jgi:dihydrofolate reductase/thymidylate synthase
MNSNLVYNIILCTDINKGISKNGKIPWKFQEDSNFFRDKINKSQNKQSIIIMGRKTYEEMNVVKNKINIIISSTLKNIPLSDVKSDDNTQVYILGEIGLIESFIINNLCIDNPEIWVCGGKQIYDYFLQKPASRINILWTEIQSDYYCDNHIMFFHTEDFEKSISLECKDLLSNNNNHQLIFRQSCKVNYYNKVNYDNKPEQAYLDEMYNILTTGSYTKCRNGYTLSKFGSMLKFNLDSFPLLTTKKIQFKTIFEELMFFIRGDTNNKHLREKGVKIWDGNTTKEFIDKCGLKYEEDDLGPMYGFQWRHFNAEYKDCNQNYSGQGFDQLKYILTELKSNPTSRRLIFTTYNPAQAFQGVLFPCHGICIQFNVEPVVNLETKVAFKLNISENQRSCDYFLGVPFNIASYALLNYMVCSVLNSDPDCAYRFIPGELTMFLGDYHLYEEHLIQAKRQILRTPKAFPKLNIINGRTNIEDFCFEDFVLEGYEPEPFIQAKMIA